MEIHAKVEIYYSQAKYLSKAIKKQIELIKQAITRWMAEADAKQ